MSTLNSTNMDTSRQSTKVRHAPGGTTSINLAFDEPSVPATPPRKQAPAMNGAVKQDSEVAKVRRQHSLFSHMISCGIPCLLHQEEHYPFALHVNYMLDATVLFFFSGFFFSFLVSNPNQLSLSSPLFQAPKEEVVVAENGVKPKEVDGAGLTIGVVFTSSTSSNEVLKQRTIEQLQSRGKNATYTYMCHVRKLVCMPSGGREFSLISLQLFPHAFILYMCNFC